MKPTATQIARDANRELAKVIDREAPPERIIKALADALEADMANRDGTRGPDHRTRTQAAALLLQYRIGRPVERQEVISVNLDADSAVGMQERLRQSPSLREALKAQIAAAEEAIEI